MASQYDVVIRKSRPEDLKVLYEMTTAENWGIPWVDYDAHLKVFPDAVLVADDTSGSSVGFISLAVIGDNGYISHFIVRENLRRRGIGRKLWEAVMILATNKNLCLDTLLPMEKWYAKKGFVIASYYVHTQTGTVTKECLMRRPESEEGLKIVPLDDANIKDLLEYDKSVYIINRSEMLRAWFAEDVKKYVMVAVSIGRVVGYGHIFEIAKDQYNIRTVLGDRQNIVDVIMDSLLQQISFENSAKVRFSLVSEKKRPRQLSEFQDHFTARRLFSKCDYHSDLQRMYITCDHTF